MKEINQSLKDERVLKLKKVSLIASYVLIATGILGFLAGIILNSYGSMGAGILTLIAGIVYLLDLEIRGIKADIIKLEKAIDSLEKENS